MYEYIPNQIIEGSLKAVIMIIKYVFFISNDIWCYANDLYFNEDDFEEEEEKEEETTTDILSLLGEVFPIPEEYAWEYDLKLLLSNICNYFFGQSVTENEEPIKKSHIPVDYIDKYKEELSKSFSLSVSNPQEKDVDSLKKNVLIENTPFGNVIMFYDSSKNSFIYYSDKTLSYPVVNTVGRKYVLTFGCEFLYVDENNPIKKSTTIESPSSKPLNKPTTTNKNVYAKFKNYKNPNSTTTPILSTSSSSNNKKKEEVKEEQINRYTCEGKLSNFSFLQKVQKVKAFSYKDFKNKFKSTD
jgi:hypothetical protein